MKTKSRKSRAMETIAGAAIGAAIAGPAGAVAAGLVASKLDSGIQRARRPRTVRKPVVDDADDPITHLWLKRVLVPLDFSPPSQRAMRFALEWATIFEAEICLLHVIEPTAAVGEFGTVPMGAIQPDIPGRARTALRELACKEFPNAMPVRVMVRKGNASDQITAAARELSADLIIIASHGHTGLKRVVLGSTAELVARHAPCPVLILRRRPRA